MSETKAEIDLQEFCECDEYPRYEINKPWVESGWRYATDGRVLVRVPAIDEPDSPQPINGKKRPRGFEIMQPVDGDWLPWPQIKKCTMCGSRDRRMPCDHCSGSGICICECENEHKCGHCNGTGKRECTTCIGNTVPHLFGKSKLAHKYAWLIAQLPDVEYLPTDSKDADLVRFKFEGGEGAVCPLRQE